MRLGYETDAWKKNERMYKKLKSMFDEQVDQFDDRVRKLKEEQEKDLIRQFNSGLAKMKKKIEEHKTSKSGEQGADMKDRENELQHHLELITNIAQRIDNENRTLLKKNQELRNEYRAQENDRELLVKQLVMQKKENQKAREDIEFYERIIAQKQEEDGVEEQLDIDGMDDEKPMTATNGQRKRSQLNTRASNRS